MESLAHGERHLYRPHDRKSPYGSAARADVVTTQIVRNALNSAANQMKRVLIRTSVSPVIYEAFDFAVALYDREIRMLAQSPTAPAFMGTMSFCVEAALEGVGGEAVIEPGDVILYNIPYGTGSHAQDLAIVMPAFHKDEIVGYAAAKGHLADIGAKNPYCSDTTDLFQEGVLLPGIKLYRRGVLVPDVLRILVANTRAPTAVEGDIMAEIASCHAGVAELERVVDRFGLQVFKDSAERMYEHGESIVRDFVAQLPDGTYRATGHLDNDGLDNEPISFDVALQVDGDLVRFDLSDVPDAVRGPLNCPLPSTVSACRIVLSMLAGNEAPNEGHFRPLEVITQVGSMFHPVLPQPCYMYGWPFMSLIEALFEALATALPGGVPSGSAGDILATGLYRYDDATGELQTAGSAIPVGGGASAFADGATMFVPALASSQIPSAELQESKSPHVQFQRWEFLPDSAGPGQFRGGMGWELELRVSTAVELITVVERTKVPSWGQAGGLPGQPNQVVLNYSDGRITPTTKVTGLQLPAETVVTIRAGGGGGYGKPADRAVDAVRKDLDAGLVTEAHVREFYAHALTTGE
jgi:N-methylhydantoinase B